MRLGFGRKKRVREEGEFVSAAGMEGSKMMVVKE